jgi:CENP-B N-terminal DNA-binding domain
MQHFRMDPVRDRRRTRTLTLSKKVLILQLLSKGHTQCSLARRFHTTQPTISKILANRKTILKLAKNGNGAKHNSKSVEYSTDSEEDNEEVTNEEDDSSDSGGDDDDDDGYECKQSDERAAIGSKTTKSKFDRKFISHITRYVNDILEGRLKLEEYPLSELCQQKDNLCRLVRDSTSLSTKRAILQDSDLLRVLIYPLFEFYENRNNCESNI